ncbi:MAG: hypothetical protein NDI95_12845 [Acidovorax soli]|uniref:hypothetical protein n=1 Tax=Acidovorax soli TaxID=592050 RepID=UPI0026F14894|nr:hypothetical protein [Acidovorax soli]MCM2347503.1 hypothetical protein [Acidovorax soli]
MSLFSWFSRKSQPSKPLEPSGLLNADATIPMAAERNPALDARLADHAANRKNERMERRELLYTVVRDAMVRAGVLSASYKFKVLSLDQRGRQFLVMMDLAREFGGETARLSEIEALVAQTAKARYDILVTAVYWRINDHVAVGIPQKGIAPQGASLSALASAAPMAPAMPVRAPSVRPVAHAAPPVPPARSAAAPAARSAQRFDPIEADEVAAFKRALSDAASVRATPAAATKPGVPVRSGPLLAPSRPTGFEDTVMQGADRPLPDLSSTQYGDLN